MSDTYSQHADICTMFYELSLDAAAVADFVSSKIGTISGQSALFVGGMFNVAKVLSEVGLEMTIVDYTDEMVQIGRKRAPNARVLKADLRTMPFESEFDLVFVIGRVFTHMSTNRDLHSAIQSCKRALKPGGKLIADNYETSRIQVTNYFNGEVRCVGDDVIIVRRSTTTLLSSNPCLVRWDAEYTGRYNGEDFSFSDSMEHRGYSREEFAGALKVSGFEVLEQGDNFDETSFYTVAIKAV